ncbi:MAG: type I-E CRISPR-associated protein Cas6/Cse3/CasE [Zoogloeaceae bacterium]|jgi:CRISPR system Cascade subunit CasE|nr:type I-E CRISPR-associated protein Cas6/Cse3/CasE [Zoogloeaceae bacterium]
MTQRYFSKVRLLVRPSGNTWLRDLLAHGESYRDHALIWRLFPGDGMPRDFLFRRLDGEWSYFVVSARLPRDDGLFEVQTKAYEPRLVKGTLLRFDLRANPAVSKNESGRSQRHDVLMEAKHRLSIAETSNAMSNTLSETQGKAGREWLLARAGKWGLKVSADSLLQESYRQHRLKHKGRAIAYSSLDYQGIAQVDDPDLLQQALFNGIGHAKGFGCGLLLVKKLA